MKLEHVLLILLLSMVAIFVLLTTIEAPPHATGMAHPDHEAMNLAGDGASRAEGVLLPAFAFALVQVAFFTGLLLLGIRRPGQPLSRYRPILVVGALYALVFAGLFRSYHAYLRDPMADSLFLGVPAPTAWMLLGVWWTPLLLVWFYERRFADWVFSDADQERLTQLIELGRDQRSGGRSA